LERRQEVGAPQPASAQPHSQKARPIGTKNSLAEIGKGAIEGRPSSLGSAISDSSKGALHMAGMSTVCGPILPIRLASRPASSPAGETVSRQEGRSLDGNFIGAQAAGWQAS